MQRASAMRDPDPRFATSESGHGHYDVMRDLDTGPWRHTFVRESHCLVRFQNFDCILYCRFIFNVWIGPAGTRTVARACQGSVLRNVQEHCYIMAVEVSHIARSMRYESFNNCCPHQSYVGEHVLLSLVMFLNNFNLICF